MVDVIFVTVLIFFILLGGVIILGPIIFLILMCVRNRKCTNRMANSPLQAAPFVVEQNNFQAVPPMAPAVMFNSPKNVSVQ
ncbi:hypothetical protein BV898_06300 [Hypsibius exemplaris]|uniref:Transmembrane protein n=1 Tax=Hypsibius exemplaris TaxID=2072580 RepID=A0A1W0WX39_HYPEX|nr:hypothetical protein BV898_06300 [Hypsibius exemplaris]